MPLPDLENNREERGGAEIKPKKLRVLRALCGEMGKMKDAITIT
ncbi:MAG: hypothetical protein R6X34_14055 [Chloroflexota bacterium]